MISDFALLAGRIDELEMRLRSLERVTTDLLQKVERYDLQQEKSAHMLSLVVGRMMITDPQWGARIDIMMLAQKGEITAERAAELVAELEGGPWQ
jgi:uncharacterized coiled-coil protein SlyX